MWRKENFGVMSSETSRLAPNAWSGPCCALWFERTVPFAFDVEFRKESVVESMLMMPWIFLPSRVESMSP